LVVTSLIILVATSSDLTFLRIIITSKPVVALIFLFSGCVALT
jgi:hypothetical protein